PPKHPTPGSAWRTTGPGRSPSRWRCRRNHGGNLRRRCWSSSAPGFPTRPRSWPWRRLRERPAGPSPSSPPGLLSPSMNPSRAPGPASSPRPSSASQRRAPTSPRSTTPRGKRARPGSAWASGKGSAGGTSPACPAGSGMYAASTKSRACPPGRGSAWPGWSPLARWWGGRSRGGRPAPPGESRKLRGSAAGAAPPLSDRSGKLEADARIPSGRRHRGPRPSSGLHLALLEEVGDGVHQLVQGASGTRLDKADVVPLDDQDPGHLHAGAATAARAGAALGVAAASTPEPEADVDDGDEGEGADLHGLADHGLGAHALHDLVNDRLNVHRPTSYPRLPCPPEPS